MERIDCRRCRYFRVTWESAFPYACDLFGFKGRQMPSVTVFAGSGSPCREFSPKNKEGESAGNQKDRGFRA
ncbi:MAG: uracil-DNA glycosylase [Helicobacteraceae bacterium]|nr:uracil-DNA glycosylase [Helicobacteraceae bacterium]